MPTNTAPPPQGLSLLLGRLRQWLPQGLSLPLLPQGLLLLSLLLDPLLLSLPQGLLRQWLPQGLSLPLRRPRPQDLLLLSLPQGLLLPLRRSRPWERGRREKSRSL